MATRHNDPYVRERERTEIREDRSSPVMLIVGLILAAAIAMAAWFAFNGSGTSDDVTPTQPGTEEQVAPGDTGGDAGTTDGTGDTTTP